MKICIGKNIQSIRKRRGLTQPELATAAHMSQGAINRLENGHIMISVEKLSLISDILEVPMESLFAPKCDEERIDQKLYAFILQLTEKDKIFLLEVLNLYLNNKRA